MKKYGLMLLALLVCGAGMATQDATLTQREVRDPRQLETILEANATDAESRLAAIEAGTAIDDLTVNNATVRTNETVGGTLGVTGVATFTATPICKDGLTVETNVTAGGVVDASSYTADAGSGIDVQSAGALDIGNTTATSIEYGSASVTVHTLVASGTGDAVVVLPLLSVGNGEINDVAATKLSGDIAIARMAEALKVPGAIGGTTPAAGAFTTVGATDRITGEVTATTDSTAIANYINVDVSGTHGVDANLSYALGNYSKVTGANYAGTNVYMAGCVGMWNVTGTCASVYPKAAVLGWIGGVSTTADGAFVALIDGDTDVTTADAAFTVRSCNSTPTSGFEYGLDLFTTAILSYNVVDILTADIRLHEGAIIHNTDSNTLTITEANVAVDGAFTATSYEGVVAATLTAGAAAGATALQPGIITCSGVTNGITNSVITIANTLASKTTLTGWISATAGGAGTAVNLHLVTEGANTTLLSASDESTVVFTGHTDGAAELAITVDAAVTRYFNVVQRDGTIKSSAAMVFDGP